MASVAVQISRLPDMGRFELVQKWREVFSTDCPYPTNRQFMIQRIAHQLQVRRYGALDETSLKRLSGYAEDIPQRVQSEHRVSRPLPGTIIIRQYKDEEHRVVVLHRGFEYRNVQYNSLSEVSKIITGTHCSGPLFFGLVRRAPKVGGR